MIRLASHQTTWPDPLQKSRHCGRWTMHGYGRHHGHRGRYLSPMPILVTVVQSRRNRAWTAQGTVKQFKSAPITAQPARDGAGECPDLCIACTPRCSRINSTDSSRSLSVDHFQTSTRRWLRRNIAHLTGFGNTGVCRRISRLMGESDLPGQWPLLHPVGISREVKGLIWHSSPSPKYCWGISGH